MSSNLYQRNQNILFLLTLVLLGSLYGIFTYGSKSVSLIEENHEEEQEYLEKKDWQDRYSNFFSTLPDGVETILSNKPQTTGIFIYLSETAQTYNILTSNFVIIDQGSNSGLIKNQHVTTSRITFDFIGSRYNIKEFMSRLEEATPLITISSFDLTFNQEDGATRGSIILETYSFTHKEEVDVTIPLEKDIQNALPQNHPSYPYFFEVSTKKSEVLKALEKITSEQESF